MVVIEFPVRIWAPWDYIAATSRFTISDRFGNFENVRSCTKIFRTTMHVIGILFEMGLLCDVAIQVLLWSVGGTWVNWYSNGWRMWWTRRETSFMNRNNISVDLACGHNPGWLYVQALTLLQPKLPRGKRKRRDCRRKPRKTIRNYTESSRSTGRHIRNCAKLISRYSTVMPRV